MKVDGRAEVIVIGAGIAGGSVAYELASERRVLLLERESQPGSCRAAPRSTAGRHRVAP